MQHTTLSYSLIAFSVMLVGIAPSCLSAEAPKTSTDVGFILDIQGKWRLEGKDSRQLLMGEALTMGAVIRAENPEQHDDYITIAYLDGQAKIYACSVRATCSQPIPMPKEQPSPSAYTAIIEAAKRLFQHNPYQYISVLSRGVELQEGVVELRDGQIDLAPVFRNTPKGVYRLLLVPLKKADQIRVEANPISFVWDPVRPSRLQVEGLQSDAYEIILLEPSTDSQEPLGVDAWMVIVPFQRYAEAQKKFNSTIQLIKSWGNEVKPDAARAFLRAYLLDLATQEKSMSQTIVPDTQ